MCPRSLKVHVSLRSIALTMGICAGGVGFGAGMAEAQHSQDRPAAAAQHAPDRAAAAAQHGGAADQPHTPLARVRPAVPYAGTARGLERMGDGAAVTQGFALTPRTAPRAQFDPREMNADSVKRFGASVLRDWKPQERAFGQADRLNPVERDAHAAKIGDKWFMNYRYQYGDQARGGSDVPLWRGSSGLVVLGGDGKVLAIRERNLPSGVDATQPEVASNAAGDLCRQEFERVFPGHQALVGEPRLEIWVPDDGEEGRLSWLVEVRSASRVDPKAARYWVAATDGPEVLANEFLIFHAHEGTVNGSHWVASPLGAVANEGLRDLIVTRVGSDGGAQTTDTNGAFRFENGTGAANFSAGLSGPFCEVHNLSGPGMTRSQSGDENGSIGLDFNAVGEDELAQVSAFYWTNQAHEFTKDIIGAGLDRLETNVNIDAACNAFWDGFSINFFRSGGTCPNTAYSDVVLHEYGHGVDDRLGGIQDGGYSEGFGDALAILVTRQPCLGRDFLGAGTCLRDATEVFTWPPPDPFDVHTTGRIYAGFVWELTQRLVSDGNSEDEAFGIAKNLVLAAAAGNPFDIPDAVFLSFLFDDDDGDLSNGTPHFAALAAAADSRNIPRILGPDEPVPPLPSGDCCPVMATAQFEFGQVTVSTDATIASVDVSIDRPMQVQIAANTSATSLGGPQLITTGFSDIENPGLMWGESLRFVSFQGAGDWENFGSTVSVTLPAGNHTLRWKVWVSGVPLAFDSGSMSVIAVPVAGTSAGATSRPIEVAKGTAAARRARDQRGNQVVQNAN